MAFKEKIDADGILIPLNASDKEDVLSKLVEFLCSTGKIDMARRGNILQALEDREALSSTGLGKGIAIPHAKIPGLEDFVVALGVAPDGVDFNALDGEESRVFFLLLAPPEQASLHIEALSEIAVMSQKENFVNDIAAADSPSAVLELLLRD